MRKVKEWVLRYLPGEISGTTAAVLGAWGALMLSSSPAIAALAGTLFENAGFYGYHILREAYAQTKRERARHAPLRYFRVALRTIGVVVTEFGPAEFFDSFLLRPFFLYIMPRLLGDFVLGIIVGKIAADIFFYAVTVGAYESRKRFMHNGGARRRA